MKTGAIGGNQASVLALVMAPTGELALAADPEALRFGAPFAGGKPPAPPA